MAQVGSFNQFQRQVGISSMLANVENLNDIRMLKSRDGLGLAPESQSTFGGQVRSSQNQLESDQAIELAVARPIYDSRGATTDFFQKLITLNLRLWRAFRTRPIRESIKERLGFRNRPGATSLRKRRLKVRLGRPRRTESQTVQGFL